MYMLIYVLIGFGTSLLVGVGPWGWEWWVVAMPLILLAYTVGNGNASLR